MRVNYIGPNNNNGYGYIWVLHKARIRSAVPAPPLRTGISPWLPRHACPGNKNPVISPGRLHRVHVHGDLRLSARLPVHLLPGNSGLRRPAGRRRLPHHLPDEESARSDPDSRLLRKAPWVTRNGLATDRAATAASGAVCSPDDPDTLPAFHHRQQNWMICAIIRRESRQRNTRRVGDIAAFSAGTMASAEVAVDGLFLRPAGGPAPAGFYSSMAPPVLRRCCRKV
jgi:hypothetical protein